MKPEQRLDELLDRWEESVERGTAIDPIDLCKSFPELLGPLQRKIAALKKMDGCFQAHENQPPKRRPNKLEKQSVAFDAELVDLEFHDRGGLGIVYKAQDGELHREVAVKFLHERVAQSEEERRRFLQEAEITGRLDHPGVVPVYANGTTDQDQPFYVMRFIQGDTLDDAIKEYHKTKSRQSASDRRVARQKLLVQLVSVCQTIGYAHTRGILHRDIKPKNIMLGKHGETLVVDWGIAIPFQRKGQFRVKEEKTLVPQTSQESGTGREGEGTPVFMSPEQAAGQDSLGPTSDIYSLGAVLYRALTGKFAFDGKSSIEIKTAIMRGEFESPRKIDKSIPTTLEAICLKAMRFDKSERYQTATAMAEDLESYLADAPITAYKYTTLEKMAILIRQNQSLFTTLFAAALLLTTVSMVAYGIQLKLKRESQHLLKAASASQRESLHMTCLMTARSIKYNLEARLIAMEELASSPAFIDLVANPPSDNPTRLKDLLKTNRNEIQSRLPSISWFILDPEGKLLCRAADNQQNSEADDASHWMHSYFHGEEHSIPRSSKTISRHPPISRPALSPVYVGENGALCSLSVPIQDKQHDIAGVLVMEMQMGQFDPLIETDSHVNASTQRFAALVESRGKLKRSLLHHPGIRTLSSNDIKTVQVCESMFESLMKIDMEENHPQTVLDYVDPLKQDYVGEWLSVAVPIQIRSRNNKRVECGWFLMVQDRPILASGP